MLFEILVLVCCYDLCYDFICWIFLLFVCSVLGAKMFTNKWEIAGLESWENCAPSNPRKKKKRLDPIPYHPCMVYIYTYILLIFMIHVGKYIIHGCYGYDLEKQFSALGDFFWCPARCRGCKLLRVATMGPQTVASGFNLILQPLTKGFRHPNTSSGLVL